MNELNDILNASEAAQLLGAHVETIRRMARRGALPSFKVGKDWRFRRDALLQWMETQQIRRRPPCILAVDDDASIRKLIRRYLDPQGYRVITASDGDDGLKILSRNTVRLVLLDLQMPVMTGPEFIQELKRSHPEIPVIIVTGHPDSTMMMEANRYGPLMLIPKPVEKQTLLSAVDMVLKGTMSARDVL